MQTNLVHNHPCLIVVNTAKHKVNSTFAATGVPLALVVTCQTLYESFESINCCDIDCVTLQSKKTSWMEFSIVQNSQKTPHVIAT